MRIGVSGLAVQLSDGAEGEAGQVTWEYRNKGGSLQWSVLPNDIQIQVRGPGHERCIDARGVL